MHAPGLIKRALGANPHLQAELGEGEATKLEGNGSSWEQNRPVEMQTGRCSPSQCQPEPPLAPNHPRGWACSVTPGPPPLLSPCLPLPAFWGLLPGLVSLILAHLAKADPWAGGQPLCHDASPAPLGDPCHLPTVAPRAHSTKKRGRKGAEGRDVGWKCLALPHGCCWGRPCPRSLPACARLCSVLINA